jgi:hypothetical protein
VKATNEEVCWVNNLFFSFETLEWFCFKLVI